MIRARPRRLCALVMLGVASTRAGHAQQGGAPAPRPTTVSTVADPYDASLVLEAQGDLAGARARLVAGYGAHPTAYTPAVRLAWLTLQLGRPREAAELYRWARERPGSLPEASYGLTLALTAQGYVDLDRGALGEARAAWTEAVGIDSMNADARRGIALLGGPSGLAVEAWGAALSATSNDSRAQVVYVQVPVRLAPDLSVRAAFRQVAGATATGASGVFGQQSEFYGGVSKDLGIANVELLGFGMSGSGRSNGGAAVALRVGGRMGVAATASFIARTGGNNLQLTPMAFVYLSDALSLAGGARITSDSSFTAVSPTASLAYRRGSFSLDVVGHVGKEQWAFSAAGPTVLSFLDRTTGGVTATVGFQPTTRVTVFGQLQAEQTQSSGSFQSLGVGVRITP